MKEVSPRFRSRGGGWYADAEGVGTGVVLCCLLTPVCLLAVLIAVLTGERGVLPKLALLPILMLGLVWHLRGAVYRAYVSYLVEHRLRPRLRIEDLPPVNESEIEFSILATDLVTGEPVAFSSLGVYSTSRGSAEPGSLTLVDAVLASASVPFILPTRRIGRYEFRFRGDRDEQRPMVLTDGGVHGNLGMGWYFDRAKVTTRSEVIPVKNVLIVNAGRPIKIGTRLARLPVLGSLLQLRRTLELLLHHSTRAQRLLHAKLEPRTTTTPAFGEICLMPDIASDELFHAPMSSSRLRTEHEARITNDRAARAVKIPTTVRQLKLFEARFLLHVGYERCADHLTDIGVVSVATVLELTDERLDRTVFRSKRSARATGGPER